MTATILKSGLSNTSAKIGFGSPSVSWEMLKVMFDEDDKLYSSSAWNFPSS